MGALRIDLEGDETALLFAHGVQVAKIGSARGRAYLFIEAPPEIKISRSSVLERDSAAARAHVVRAGESLSSITAFYKRTDWAPLFLSNLDIIARWQEERGALTAGRLPDPNLIYPGMGLRLPIGWKA